MRAKRFCLTLSSLIFFFHAVDFCLPPLLPRRPPRFLQERREDGKYNMGEIPAHIYWPVLRCAWHTFHLPSCFLKTVVQTAMSSLALPWYLKDACSR